MKYMELNRQDYFLMLKSRQADEVWREVLGPAADGQVEPNHPVAWEQ
jgi:hypothetical protein